MCLKSSAKRFQVLGRTNTLILAQFQEACLAVTVLAKNGKLEKTLQGQQHTSLRLNSTRVSLQLSKNNEIFLNL